MPEAVPMVKLEEAARQAQVSPRTARRWAKAGTMPAVLLGGRWRIAPERLEEFLRRGSPQPAKEQL